MVVRYKKNRRNACYDSAHLASTKDLAAVLLEAIERVLKKALTEESGKLPADSLRKIEDMIGVYSKINDEPLKRWDN